jgi:hypothetical protein
LHQNKGDSGGSYDIFKQLRKWIGSCEQMHSRIF